jgi:hypothetical protein
MLREVGGNGGGSGAHRERLCWYLGQLRPSANPLQMVLMKWQLAANGFLLGFYLVMFL